MSRGIDYGMGQTNIDKANGIRYGVIPQNDVLQSWADSSEADYGPACCQKCGNEAVAIDDEGVPDLDDEPEDWHDEGRDYACLSCARSFDSDDAFSDEPLGFYLDDGEYEAYQGGDDSDIFITKSPYYTYGPFCSPCAPGAVYLRDAKGDPERGAKSYCFAPDWFDPCSEDEVTGEYCGEKTACPYAVFRVEDDVCVFVPTQKK